MASQSSSTTDSPAHDASDEGYGSQPVLGSEVTPQSVIDTISKLQRNIRTLQAIHTESLDEIRRLSQIVHDLKHVIAETIPTNTTIPLPPSTPEASFPLPTAPPVPHPVVVSPPSVPSSFTPSGASLPPPTLTPAGPVPKPRSLAREDTIIISEEAPRSEMRSRGLKREGAFYHISDSEVYPWRIPDTVPRPATPHPEATPVKESSSAPSTSPKRKRSSSEEVDSSEGVKLLEGPEASRSSPAEGSSKRRKRHNSSKDGSS